MYFQIYILYLGKELKDNISIKYILRKIRKNEFHRKLDYFFTQPSKV